MAPKKNEVFVTVSLPKILKRQLKLDADKTGMKLKALIGKALTEWLAQKGPRNAR